MNDQLASPLDTFSRLLNEANDARRKRSLEALNEVCQLLNERGSLDFSYRNIVLLGRDRGLPVPGEKSIVNATGAHYRELIQSWKLVSVAPKERSKTTANDWVEIIEDPVLRLNVTLLAKELLAVKAKIARQEKYAGAPIYLGGTQGCTQAQSKSIDLNDAELDALRAAVDPAVLSPLGFNIGSRGEVTDLKGNRIFKPGFRDAIEKILSVQ